CALPTCAENAAAVIAKKAGAISSHTRICASSRDWCRCRYLLGRCRVRQITHQYWHFLTASSRSPRGRTLTMPVLAECMTNISEAGKARLDPDVAAALIAMRL